MSPGSQKLSRFVARRRKAAHSAEKFIASYDFPAHIEKRVRRRHSSLGQDDWKLVEKGLREWFVCCAWRGGTVLGMPSRLVDDAWHELILDSISYMNFCEIAFGAYLHHSPEEVMGGGMSDALADTVRAWDRSKMGSEQESVLWDLDERLGVRKPLGVSMVQLSAVRARVPYVGTGGACGGFAGEADGGSSGGGSDGCGGGGCGGGS